MRRFGWKKFAIGAVVLIGLVWVFGPRKEDIIPEKYRQCEWSILPMCMNEVVAVVAATILTTIIRSLCSHSEDPSAKLWLFRRR